ncbi:hypothetical protein [Phenylobacterium sp.]|uniref:hypothetical protein n=1 Tax=Phenylobacterium sp. TaxID=1871053 RepID=UPI00121C0B4B|nr:hypothetical protein [Phenylobacterium sp.]THD58933.1 MAG: hypothetical protein E8A49_18270 [Phenylobacterium sp.]
MAGSEGPLSPSAASGTPGSGALANIPRLLSLDVQEAVERFSDPQLMAAGKLNIISVEAVQKRFGARWALRKDQVLDFTDRVLERGVANQGAYLRVSETDFFVVHPDLGRLAGQAACLRYLREVLNHFLGDSHMAAAGIMQVTSIGKGRLEAAAVDAVQAEASLGEIRSPEPDAASPPAAIVNAEAEAAAPVNRWTPFVSTDGRRLRVSATLEPVYELKGFTRIGFRMIRRVVVIATGEDLTPKQVAALSPGDLLRADMATITRGIDRLKAEAGGEQLLSLIVPVSFVSLSSQRGRAEVSVPLREAGGLVKLGVITEILDIDGVPQGVLLAATSMVRPLALLVVGRVAAPSPNVIAPLAGGGLQALSFECPQGLGDAEFIGWATAAIGAAKKIAKSVLVFRVGSAQRAGALASLGATHASLVAA